STRNVEESGRLVKHGNLRTLRKDLTILNLLPHSAAHQPGPLVPRIPEIDSPQNLLHAILALHLVEVRRHLQVPVEHVKRSQYSINSRILEGDSNLLSHIVRMLNDIQSIHGNLAARWAIDCAHHQHQGRLACSVRTQESKNLL